MPNHLHLLVRVGEVPLHTFMHSLLLSHAKWWNTKYEQSGHLFQKRYYPVICDRDEYLLAIARYIHLNPVRAKLAATPRAWPWSSLPAYLDGTLPWVETALILDQFNEKTHAQAVARFQEFLEAGLKDSKLRWTVKDGRYAMESDQEVRESLTDSHMAKEIEQIEVSPLENHALLTLVGQAEGIPVEELMGQGRQSRAVKVRRALAEAVHQWWGWDTNRTANLLGQNRSTVAKIYRRYNGEPPRGIKSMIDRWKALLLQHQRDA